MPEKPELRRFFVSADKLDLFTNYLKRRDGDLELLRKGIDELDFETIQRLGHKMCGNGGIFGFDRITELGKDLETAAKAKDLPKVRQHTLLLSDYLASIEICPRVDE